jgi:hypothetical protein
MYQPAPLVMLPVLRVLVVADIFLGLSLTAL